MSVIWAPLLYMYEERVRNRSQRLIFKIEQRKNEIPHYNDYGCCVCLCMCGRFSQHWTSEQVENNSIKCHTHTHIWTFSIFVLWSHVLVWIMVYSNISEIFNQPEMIGNILKERIYELSFFFSSGSSHHPPTLLHFDASLYSACDNELHKWGWHARIYYVWLTTPNLWSNYSDTIEVSKNYRPRAQTKSSR